MPTELLESRRFDFVPFTHPHHPGGIGDSGRLQLATLKSCLDIQYIVKSGFPELGCNEYMYHKVASALGLYTQEVRLFKNKVYQHAAAVRYVPKARPYKHSEASAENRNAFYNFQSLYVILNEYDSDEYFLDENDRLFKLDNAGSFKLDTADTLAINAIGGYGMGNGVYNTGAEKYEFSRAFYVEKHGQEANEPFLETFRRFAKLDLDDFLDDLEVLEYNYSLHIARYFYGFLEQRIKACGEYVKQLGT